MKTLDELDALYAEMMSARPWSAAGSGRAFLSALSAAWPEVRERLRRAEVVEREAEDAPHRVGDVWERSERLVVRELGVDGQPLRLHHDTLGERWWSVRGLVGAGWRRVSRAALTEEPPR